MCIQFYNDDLTKRVKDDKFYIIRGNKLTKREKKAEQENAQLFEYVLYDKIETKESENNHEFEKIKTENFIKIVDCVYNIVYNNYKRCDNPEDPVLNIWICQEGISYGSTLRTKSIFDLAGLNYMIRTAMMKFSSNLIIAPPSHVKKFATGSGNANKELMIETFKSIHPEFDIPKIDDIADAFFMSRLAQRYFEQDKF